VEGISNNEEIFKETCFGENNQGSDFKTVMIYAGIIRNFECPCSIKCGKIKIGYITAEKMHTRH
jgi:hypothetical protein